MSERPEPRSPTARFLFWLANAIFKHRALFFWPQLVLMGLCISAASEASHTAPKLNVTVTNNNRPQIP